MSSNTPTKSNKLESESRPRTPKWKKDVLLREFKPTACPKEHKQRLILDEEKFEDTFLRCMVCQEVFDRTTNIPKVLNCQHDVCLNCLLEMFRVESEYRVQMTTAFGNRGPTAVKIQCPACRESTVRSEAEIRSLPNDITLLALGEFVKKSERCVVSFCLDHPSIPMNFYCNSCQRQVCSECTVADHCPRDGHDIVGVDTAVIESATDIEATLNIADEECAKFAEARKTFQLAIEQLDSAGGSITQDILATFDTFRHGSDPRALELVGISRLEIDNKRKFLLENLQSISKREAELNASRSLLQEACDHDDFDQMFAHHKIIKETLSQRVPLPVCNKDDLKMLFSFNDDEEESFVEIVDRYYET